MFYESEVSYNAKRTAISDSPKTQIMQLSVILYAHPIIFATAIIPSPAIIQIQATIKTHLIHCLAN